MSALRSLTHEEFAAIKAKGWAAVDSFVKERAARVEVAERIRETAKALRDDAARAKIDEMLLEGEDLEKLESLLEKLNTAIIWQGDSEDRIRRKASRYYSAERIKRHATATDPMGYVAMMESHVESLHLTPAQRRRLDKHDPMKPIDQKLRRMLRMNAKQGTATLNMHLGLIGSDGHHVTPHELQMRNDQKGRWAKFGESTMLSRGEESVSMLTVMQSAHTKKLAEIYTLTKGIEAYAKAAGLTWAFLTLTAPPRMHPNPDNGHSTWDGTTPDQAHEWIHKAFHKTEARLRTTHGIVISGLRVVEPHKDGAPHWHELIFAHASDMATIEAEFRKQPEWKSEQGFKFVENDGRASAASYCFKYILKTVNSIEQLSGENGTVDAWRSTWGIRSFQWFGMPRIQLWRDLRAVKECPEEPLLAGLWRAAHRGDGHAFIGLAGGLNVKSKNRPVVSRTTSDNKIKSIEFILQETAESIKFNFKKWQKQPGSRASAGLEVILNYPRKSKAEASRSLTRLRLVRLPRDEEGMIPSCDLPDEGGGSLIRGRPRPSSLPPPPPVGRCGKNTPSQPGLGRFSTLPTGRVDGGDGGKAGPRMRLRLPPSRVKGDYPPCAPRTGGQAALRRVSDSTSFDTSAFDLGFMSGANAVDFSLRQGETFPAQRRKYSRSLYF